MRTVMVVGEAKDGAELCQLQYKADKESARLFCICVLPVSGEENLPGATEEESALGVHRHVENRTHEVGKSTCRELAKVSFKSTM